MLSSFAHTQFGSDVGVKWEPPGHCTQFKRQPQLAVCAEFHSFEIAKRTRETKIVEILARCRSSDSITSANKRTQP